MSEAMRQRRAALGETMQDCRPQLRQLGCEITSTHVLHQGQADQRIGKHGCRSGHERFDVAAGRADERCRDRLIDQAHQQVPEECGLFRQCAFRRDQDRAKQRPHGGYVDALLLCGVLYQAAAHCAPKCKRRRSRIENQQPFYQNQGRSASRKTSKPGQTPNRSAEPLDMSLQA
jgi:hypothetical protein